MSFVIVLPPVLTAAASDLAGIGSAFSAANALVMGPTTGLAAAAADEVSTGIAALFDAHAQTYQEIGAQAAVYHAQFVAALTSGARWYAAAEAASASPMQEALNLINGPTQALLGRPLIADGATGGPGQAGGLGGLLFGNGGTGGAGAPGRPAAVGVVRGCSVTAAVVGPAVPARPAVTAAQADCYTAMGAPVVEAG